MRRAERLVRAIDEAVGARCAACRVLNQDKVWDRVRQRRARRAAAVRLDPGRRGRRAWPRDLDRAPVLDEIDVAAQEARLRKIREVIADRRRYVEILA